MSEAAIISPEAREKRSLRETLGAARGRIALGGGVAALVAVAVSFMIGNPDPGHAETGIQIKAREVAQLKALDTGEQAEIIDEGITAQQQNALIPESGLPVEAMGGFAAIDAGSASYSTALKCLTQAIYYEAANEPLQGKRGVAQVVLNRLRHPAYPNTVCGVVYEGVNRPVCQFSFTCDGSLLRRPMAAQWNQSRAVAAAALAGAVEPSVGSATHYHADYVLPRWAYTLSKIEKIGAHIFYRFPGSAGSTRAFTRRWAGREGIPAFDESRLRTLLAAQIEPEAPVFTPGTTVVPDVKDRHAPQDVGGRLDTTKTWRLSIPDPTRASGSYDATRAGQGEAIVEEPAKIAPVTTTAVAPKQEAKEAS